MTERGFGVLVGGGQRVIAASGACDPTIGFRQPAILYAGGVIPHTRYECKAGIEQLGVVVGTREGKPLVFSICAACVPPIFVPCCPDVPMPREATMVLLAPGSPLLDGLEVELRGYDGYGFNNYHHGNGPVGVALGQCAPDPVTFPGLFLWYWVGVEIACGLTLCSGSLVTTWRINLIVYQYFVDEPLAAYTVARLSASPAISPPHEPVYLNCDPGVAGTAQCSPLLIANEETVYLQHQGFGTFPPYPDDRNCSGAYVFETLPMDFIVT